MPEMRGKNFPGFTPEDIDTNSIRYKDKNREKQRQTLLAQQKQQKQNEAKKKFVKNKPWSKQKTKRDKKRKQASKRKLSDDEDDIDELLNDTRLLKKLKQGKISKEDFEKQLTGT